MKHQHYSLFCLATLLLLSICSPRDSMAEPVATDTYYPFSISSIPLNLQLALTPGEQSKGLMHRDSMPKDHGMLFLFKQPGPRAFWMRNTRIPLDIGYFDASGRLLEIYALEPYNEKAVRSKSQEVLIVVETNRGWFARNNITPGAKLEFIALAQALKHRGIPAVNYPFQPAH